MTIEEHPWAPFMPLSAKIFFLGSFPPPRVRWSMDFYYPNWINDFWRIQGLIHFGDKGYFERTEEKRFDQTRILSFCEENGLAFYDTARKVCRLKDNADDNFLEIVEQTDVLGLLKQMPNCQAIVTTGGKASEELLSYLTSQGYTVEIPKVGESVKVGNYAWWRMPSTSRAYPMKLEKKAEQYRKLPYA